MKTKSTATTEPTEQVRLDERQEGQKKNFFSRFFSKKRPRIRVGQAPEATLGTHYVKV